MYILRAIAAICNVFVCVCAIITIKFLLYYKLIAAHIYLADRLDYYQYMVRFGKQHFSNTLKIEYGRVLHAECVINFREMCISQFLENGSVRSFDVWYSSFDIFIMYSTETHPIPLTLRQKCERFWIYKKKYDLQ